MKIFFYKWLISWGDLISGIIGIVSFTLIRLSLGLYFAKLYSKERSN
jgi:hypothetical protein